MYRPAYLAGQWYPRSERECCAAIEGHCAEAKVESGNWRGLIAPHAGWSYSGDAAGKGFCWLAEHRADADLVVLFGSHRGPEGPNTVLRAQGWETPLGAIENAQDLADDLALDLRLRDEPAEPLRPDNAAELLMPFVRYFFPKAEMLMLGVAASHEAERIGEHVGAMAKRARRNAVFIGSTDLTHYGPNYGFEPVGQGEGALAWVREQNDQGFIDRVLAMDAVGALEHGVDEMSACCPGAVAACMKATEAYGRGKATRLVDHYLSYDILPNASFVGYAGIVL